MYQFIMVIHIFACACLIGLVLVQQGKGATIGSSFGGGASQTVFGSRGSGSFLLRVTGAFVIVFFATSISLNYIATKAVKQEKHVVLPSAPTGMPAQLVPQQQKVTPNSIPTSTGSEQQPVANKQ